jgi:DNA-binding MarR family transcriptional regulator
VARDAPLNRDEEALWRALMKVIITLPRVLDDDLRGAGLSLSEYVTLVNLSEAENHERRMSDLASAIQLSASRVSRLVEELQSRGFVEKRRGERGRSRQCHFAHTGGSAPVEARLPRPPAQRSGPGHRSARPEARQAPGSADLTGRTATGRTLSKRIPRASDRLASGQRRNPRRRVVKQWPAPMFAIRWPGLTIHGPIGPKPEL